MQGAKPPLREKDAITSSLNEPRKAFLANAWRWFVTNYDLAVPLVLAVFALVASEFGFGNVTFAAGLILLGVFTLAISMLRDRNKLINIEITMNKLIEHSTNISAKAFFKKAGIDPYSILEPLIEDAHEIWMLGISNQKTISIYFQQLEKALKNSAILKILMLDPKPSNPGVPMQALRSYTNKSSDIVIGHGREARRYFKDLSQFADVSKIELRGLDYLPAFGLMAINPDGKHGKLVVKLYPYNVAKNEYPIFSLEPERDQEWYQFFCSQFKQLWLASHPLEPLDVS